MSRLASVSEASVLRVMAGMGGVPGGTSHSCVTATMSSPSPRANRMSVALGSSEQILMPFSVILRAGSDVLLGERRGHLLTGIVTRKPSAVVVECRPQHVEKLLLLGASRERCCPRALLRV